MRRATSCLNAFCLLLVAVLAASVLATGDAFGMQAVDATHALRPGVDWLTGYTGHLDLGMGGDGGTPGFLAMAGAAGAPEGEEGEGDPPQEGADPPEEEEGEPEENTKETVARSWHDQQQRQKDREIGRLQERVEELESGEPEAPNGDDDGPDAEEVQSLREQVSSLEEERDSLQEQVSSFEADEKTDTVREGFEKHFDESKFEGPFSTDPVEQYVDEFSQNDDGELINDQGQSPEEFFGQLAQQDEYSEYRVRNADGPGYEGPTSDGPAAPTGKKRSEMTTAERSAYIEEHGGDAYMQLPKE